MLYHTTHIGESPAKIAMCQPCANCASGSSPTERRLSKIMTKAPQGFNNLYIAPTFAMTVPNLLQIFKPKLKKDKNFSTIIISSCKQSKICMLYKFPSKVSGGFRFKIPFFALQPLLHRLLPHPRGGVWVVSIWRCCV